MSKTIFITGASRGFGKLWAEAFLKRGDKVVATARKLNDLDDLAAQYGNNILPLQLDVNNRADSFAAINKARQHFGTLDVVINNAGMAILALLKKLPKLKPETSLKPTYLVYFGLPRPPYL